MVKEIKKILILELPFHHPVGFRRRPAVDSGSEPGQPGATQSRESLVPRPEHKCQGRCFGSRAAGLPTFSEEMYNIWNMVA